MTLLIERTREGDRPAFDRVFELLVTRVRHDGQKATPLLVDALRG
ncbi:MAG: hypothetical protein ABI552_18485 [Casimicrobiaceae bacterium]